MRRLCGWGGCASDVRALPHRDRRCRAADPPYAASALRSVDPGETAARSKYSASSTGSPRSDVLGGSRFPGRQPTDRDDRDARRRAASAWAARTDCIVDALGPMRDHGPTCIRICRPAPRETYPESVHADDANRKAASSTRCQGADVAVSRQLLHCEPLGRLRRLDRTPAGERISSRPVSDRGGVAYRTARLSLVLPGRVFPTL